MAKKMRKMVCVLFCTALLCTCASADDTAQEQSFEGKDWETVIDELFASEGISPYSIYIGYYNTVTGEEHYHRADEPTYGASLYKLPLNMCYAEMVYNGELEMTDMFSGKTYQDIQELSLRYSNNEYSMILKNALGSESDYCAAIAPYMGGELADGRVYYNFFTPRQMINCLKMLYAEPERYPGVLHNMLTASEGDYFELYMDGFDVAQKYGHYKTEDGEHEYIGGAGIVYADDPVLIVVMTDNCVGERYTLGKVCRYLTEYAQYKYEERMAYEAASATPEPVPPETAAPELLITAVQEPVPTPMQAVAETDAHEEREFPAAVIALAAVCVLSGAAAIVIRRKNRKRQ